MKTLGYLIVAILVIYSFHSSFSSEKKSLYILTILVNILKTKLSSKMFPNKSGLVIIIQGVWVEGLNISQRIRKLEKHPENENGVFKLHPHTHPGPIESSV